MNRLQEDKNEKTKRLGNKKTNAGYENRDKMLNKNK